MGLLSLEPKMADGSPVTDFNACILYDEHGSEIKEWYALAAYLQSFGEDGVPENYAVSDGRKLVSHDMSLQSLTVNLNWVSWLVLAVILLLVLLVVVIVRFILRRRRRIKH